MNIVLIGFMGAGKSAVGKVLAKRLNMRFFDIDALIAKKERKAISRIFRENGELYFRKIEKRAVKKYSRLNSSVIATGGGAVLDPDNVSALRANGILVCLTASPNEILTRVAKTKKRPLLMCDNPKDKVALLLKRRAPYYRKADFMIKTDGLSISEVANKIERLLNGLRY